MNKLFNRETKQGKRNIIISVVLGYWIIFWIVPSMFLNVFFDFFKFISIIFNYIFRLNFQDLEGAVYYFLIIAPLFSILPYKFLKNRFNIINKYSFIFFLFTVIVPYIYVLAFIIYAIVTFNGFEMF